MQERERQVTFTVHQAMEITDEKGKDRLLELDVFVTGVCPNEEQGVDLTKTNIMLERVGITNVKLAGCPTHIYHRQPGC